MINKSKERVYVDFNLASDVILIFEPYGYPLETKEGDHVEVAFIPDGQRISIDIEKDQITVSCYEPIISLNGKIELDMSVDKY